MTLLPSNITPVLATPTDKVAKQHVSVLSLLRGLAALSVGLYHFTGAVLPKLHIPEIHAIFANGWLGVEVFFVISGFIIPYSLVGKNYGTNNFFAFMRKRLIRINPPAYIAMILVLIQGCIIDYVISHHILYTADVSVGQIISNALFIVPFTQYKWIVGIFWTLAIEFQFYIFIGLFFNILFERSSIYAFLLIFLILGFIQYLPFQSNEHIFRFSSLFAMGGITLFYYINKINILKYLSILIILSFVAYFELNLYMALIGLGTALCISFVKINNVFFDFMGKISYSFYLVHALIGTTCEFFLVKFINPDHSLNKFMMLIICILASVFGSYIFYRLVEQRFIMLSNNALIKKIHCLVK
jgi:peptidoglycan/LPS O-acetylase OafA/YrhL